MQMNRFARKLNNKSGNSIMMALLLLLVATVVSIVIVTVALTSTMHVDDNRTSQQEYLACVSAAEMLRDGLAGSTYTYTVKSGTFKYKDKVYNWDKRVYEEEEYNESYGPKTTKDTNATNKKLNNFVTKVSEAIRDGSSWITTSGTFKVSQTDIDANNPVEAYWKITQSSDTKFYLKIKLSYKENDESEGYRMTMKIPITVGTGTPNFPNEEIVCQLENSDVRSMYWKDDTYKKEHRNVYTSGWDKGSINYNSSKNHSFKITGTVTTVSWGVTSDSDLKISKGWDAYDK